MTGQPIIINICGNIASGKSVLTAALKDWFNFPTVLEDTSRISLFSLYCQDPASWAAATQVQFLTDKISRAVSSLSAHATILDRSLYEDALIFAKLHNDIGNISNVDYRAYMEIYKNTIHFLPKLQINILVKCSSAEQRRRIYNRSAEEQGMLSTPYLKELDRRYAIFTRTTAFDLVYDSERESIQIAIDTLTRVI